MPNKKLTIILVPDSNSEPRRFRLPVWLAQTILVLVALTLMAPIVYIWFNHEIIERAAIASRLTTANDSLTSALNFKTDKLLKTRYVLTKMMDVSGLDPALLANLYADEDFATDSLSRSVPARSVWFGSPTDVMPSGLPSSGWVTRGYIASEGKKHPGIDLAVPEGTDVLSTAFGTVVMAGDDKEYGQMIIIRNNDSIETVYAHNSNLLVQVGDTVFAGQKIAQSGNTGRSSAPHLHYEIRINGQPINPIDFTGHEIQTN